MLAATALESGRAAGQATVVVAVVAAILYRLLLRPPLVPRLARPARAGVAAFIAIVLFLLAGAAARDDDADKVRADMLAGCVDSGGEAMRSYCGCVVDELMKQASTEDLARMNAEMKAAEEPGGPMPAVFAQSAGDCAPKASG